MYTTFNVGVDGKVWHPLVSLYLNDDIHYEHRDNKHLTMHCDRLEVLLAHEKQSL